MKEFAGGCAADLPVLGFLTEADVRGPEDYEPAELPEVDRLGVEAIYRAAGADSERSFHSDSPPSRCWFLLVTSCRQKSAFRVRVR